MNGKDKHSTEVEISAAELAEEMESNPEFEAYLKEAAEIPVPDGLAERILARAEQAERDEAGSASNVVSLEGARARHDVPLPMRRRWVAVAASVLLVVGLVSVSYFGRDPGMPLEQRVVIDLQDSLPTYNNMVVSRQVDPNIEVNLHQMLEVIGAKRTGDLSRVMHCETTEVGGKMAGVMVFPGEMGAVTVVYIMDTKVDNRSTIFEKGMEGIIWPERKGSIAIIAYPGEPMMGEVESQVRNSVSWF